MRVLLRRLLRRTRTAGQLAPRGTIDALDDGLVTALQSFRG